MTVDQTYDLIIVGAGPVGLSTALHARARGMRALVLDKGVVANHLLDFPIGMAWFTPRHSLELMGIPLDTTRQHATREEILSYYGRLARLAQLEIEGDRCFETYSGSDGDFTLTTRSRHGDTFTYRCRKLVLATGVFGRPRRLPAIPGADSPKVSYLYREPYSHYGKDVLLVGAGNSSAGAALALHQAGARVTVLDRNASIPAVKWRWHLEDLQQLVRRGEIRLLHGATLTAIEPRHVVVSVGGREQRYANDAVIALLGYEPDVPMLERLGITVDPASRMPHVDVRTLQTNVAGVYLAGIVCAGTSPDKIFVWGARHHPKVILGSIAGEPPLPEIVDLGADTVAHWGQFEKLGDKLDEELALRLVPIVTGENAEDSFDVFEYATRTENLYAPRPGGVIAIGSHLDALEGWLVHKNDDGSVMFKGQRLSESAYEILKLCDGTRRIRTIIETLAASYEESADELRPTVLRFILSLLRTGKLSWRVDPTTPLDPHESAALTSHAGETRSDVEQH